MIEPPSLPRLMMPTMKASMHSAATVLPAVSPSGAHMGGMRQSPTATAAQAK